MFVNYETDVVFFRLFVKKKATCHSGFRQIVPIEIPRQNLHHQSLTEASGSVTVIGSFTGGEISSALIFSSVCFST